MPLSYGPVPYLSKNLSKLPPYLCRFPFLFFSFFSFCFKKKVFSFGGFVLFFSLSLCTRLSPCSFFFIFRCSQGSFWAFFPCPFVLRLIHSPRFFFLSGIIFGRRDSSFFFSGLLLSWFTAPDVTIERGGGEKEQTNTDLGQLQVQEREFFDTFNSPCI